MSYKGICEIVNTSITTPVMGASNLDLVFRTETQGQKMMLANGSNVVPGITLSNNLVGIGKSNPIYELDVVGNINMSGLLYKNNSRLPSFRASGGANTQANGSTLVFTTVAFNNGNGYNSGTGVFTAPMAGYYWMHYSATTDGQQQYWNIELQVNNAAIENNVGYNNNGVTRTVSCTSFLSLNTNDTVRMFNPNTSYCGFTPRFAQVFMLPL